MSAGAAYLILRSSRRRYGGYGGGGDPLGLLIPLGLLLLVVGVGIGYYYWYDSCYPQKLVKSEQVTVEVTRIRGGKHPSVGLKDKATGEETSVRVRTDSDREGKVFTTTRETWKREGKDGTWYVWPNIRERLDQLK